MKLKEARSIVGRDNQKKWMKKTTSEQRSKWGKAARAIGIAKQAAKKKENNS